MDKKKSIRRSLSIYDRDCARFFINFFKGSKRHHV